MKPYCLTIEIQSEHIENGLGYMIAFSLPPGVGAPDNFPAFNKWKEEVKTAVLRAGDQCLHSDPYTKKLAVAALMHDLSDINSRHEIRIGYLPHVPAVQIHSTNVFDNIIEIDFVDVDGHYKVLERSLTDLQQSSVSEHGKTGLTDAAKKHFPFKKKTTPAAPKKNGRADNHPPRP